MTLGDKEHELIKTLEAMTPEQMVYEFSYGDGSLKNNLEAINRIRMYNLPEGVMNVLIHLTFIICEYKLSCGFMEKVAEHWLGKRIKTVEHAWEISKVESKSEL